MSQHYPFCHYLKTASQPLGQRAGHHDALAVQDPLGKASVLSVRQQGSPLSVGGIDTSIRPRDVADVSQWNGHAKQHYCVLGSQCMPAGRIVTTIRPCDVPDII